MIPAWALPIILVTTLGLLAYLLKRDRTHIDRAVDRLALRIDVVISELRKEADHARTEMKADAESDRRKFDALARDFNVLRGEHNAMKAQCGHVHSRTDDAPREP